MKKGLFYGWKDVFSFTFKQGTDKKYKSLTIIFAVILLIIGMAISVIMALVQKDEANEVSPIAKVYLVDESELAVLYLDGFKETQAEKFPDVTFESTDKDVQTLAKELGENAPNDIILKITHEEDSYLLMAILPYGSIVSEGEAEDLCDALMLSMEQSKLLSSGIPMENLVIAMSGVNTTDLDAGEQEKSLGEELVAMLLPMLVIVFMFFMVMSYGMSIGNVVSIEKSSKLMEMILTLTRPYGLILGKVSAIAVSAILQMIIWIASLVVGFFLGHFVAGNYIYTEYNNVLLEVFKLLGSAEGSAAFSIGAAILGLVTLFLGFLFYCMIASLVASFASKAEELSQVMSYFSLILLVGFYASYFVPMKESPLLDGIVRVIPITSAFKLPADILVGNVNIWIGFVEMLILLVSTLILALLAGRVYKNEVFYKGKTLKERLTRKKKKA